MLISQWQAYQKWQKNKPYKNRKNMQKIDEPDNLETDNSKYLKWIIYAIIFIAIIIFKAAAKKEIRENAKKEIESTYNNEE